MFHDQISIDKNNDSEARVIEINEDDQDELYKIESQDLSLRVGTYEEAPKFIQDNEYIKTGYLLNCNSYKRACKALCICHNELINTWSHLLGALFFIGLTFYILIFVTNFNSQYTTVENDILIIEKDVKNLEYLEKNFPKTMETIKENIKMLANDLEELNYINIYENFLIQISLLNNSNITVYINTTDYEQNTTYYKNISNYINNLLLLKEDVIHLMILDDKKKVELTPELEQELNSNNYTIKSLPRWPLFIIIFAAILCLGFSTTFHMLLHISPKHYNILNRFDYGGISLLISGSCYPPYYYFFYFSKVWKLTYLIIITVFGIGTFLYSLTDDFNKPQRRGVRGTLFLIFGLSAGIPIVHMTAFGDTIEGYSPDIEFIYWYLGGISYVVGALLYILRYPEKKCQKKFDYVGASHQIFHILVFLGALFHYLGSLDAYNYRFNKLKI